jgi:hypothetical protein
MEANQQPIAAKKLFKCGSLDDIFALLATKLDPETGRDRLLDA